MASSTQQQFRDILAKREKEDKEGITKDEVYTALSVAPGTGEAIAVKELPDDIEQIKKLFEEGYRESDFKKLGMGALYTTAVTAGLLPIAGPLGRAGKKAIKGGLDKVKPLFDKQAEMMQGFPPSGPDALATANNVPVKSVDETDKLLDKTKVDVPINTEIPTLKAQDLANKPTINPSMIGVETELGRKQVALYEKLIKDSKVLDGKPPSPQRLFERTGVYKGNDGKYRFDLDDRDATFNTSFLEKALVKNPNMKDPPTMLSNSIVSYKYLEPKLFSLREVLDFDSLYKQYGKTLKVGDKAYSNIGNTKVKFISGKSGTRGSYDGDTDTITLNISDSDGQKLTDLGKIESTLLHEVQHAIQRREGFLRGGNSDTMLDKINPRHSQEVKATTKELNDKKDLMKDNVRIGFENVDAFKHNDVRYDKEQAVNYAVDQMAIISYSKLLGKEYLEATKKLQENLGEFLKNSKFPKGIQEKIQKSGDDFFFDVQAKKVDLDAQKEKSFADYEDLYGEREARLVQKRYEKRKAYKAMSGGLDFGDDKITTALRKDTSFIDNMSNNKAQGGLQLNKGGTTMNMNKQMDMFDEGGLKEEGGTVDPISGNDVPIGSTKEEVRDDIPAQLSEGEFVFPADVTRFIGLEKLMQMRQEAKAGLKRMEDMGQMGNSEEATLPDDMPFSIDDLDTEEEEEYNNDSQEMNQGGVIQAATGTFVNQGTGVTSVPSQFAGMNLPSSGTNTAPTYTTPTIPTNVSGYTPKFTAQTGQTNQNVAPTFQTLIGKTPGQYDEMRTYVNDAGQTMQIPFKNGEPIYPIPEGYRFKDPEAIETDDPTTTAPVTKTTRVVETQQDDGGDDPDDKSVGGATMDVGGRTFSIGYNFDGSITLTDPKTGESKNYDKDNQITKDAKNVTFGQIVDLAKMTPSGIAASIIESAADKLNLKVPGSTKVEKIKIDAKTSKSRLDNTFSGIGDDPSTGMSIENMETIQKGLERDVDTSKQTDISDKAMQDRANKQAAEQRAAEQKVADARAAQRAAVKAEPRPITANTYSDDSQPSGGSSGDFGFGESTDTTDYGGTYKGSLITRNKPSKKKPKKMKRGGLASR
tara:strand:+ start:38 stop:3310 length:3273 start_codon:yes stop_codon:yes gene_type:complete